MQTGPVSAPQMKRTCVSCRREIPSDANICPYCGYDYRYAPTYVGYQANINANLPPYYQSQSTASFSVPRTSLPLAGGVCTLIGGVIGIISGLVYVLLANLLSSFDFMGMFGGFGAMMIIFGIMGAIFGLIGIIGGIFAMKRQNWAFSLVAAILIIAGGILTTYISAVLGIIGLILVAISKPEFTS